MKALKPVLFLTVLALIGAAAGVLAHAKSNQKLGLPGVKTRSLPGSQNLEVVLPAALPGYQSLALTQAAVVTNTLPPDTSFGQRAYVAEGGFQCAVNVVLMGSSRSSIHDPQYCLTGQGWTINGAASQEVQLVHLDRPVPYDLPVMKMEASRPARLNGQTVTEKCIFVYWFVDAEHYTAQHSRRMLWMARDMVLRNELDRWAYVTLFSVCLPGQEQATFDRMKRLISAAGAGISTGTPVGQMN